MKEYILPFRDLVVHQDLTVPVYIDTPQSISCVEAAVNNGGRIILVAQKTWVYPSKPSDLYDVGTIGEIAHVLRMPDGAIHVIIKTSNAVRIKDVSINNGLFIGEPEVIQTSDDANMDQTIALRDKVAENLQDLSRFQKIKIDKLHNIMQNYPLSAFVDFVSQVINLDTDVAVKVLSAASWREKLMILLEQINLMAETAKIEESINKFNLKNASILIQEMITDSMEVIIGINSDKNFGKVMVFGSGGIYTEIMKDTTIRVLPTDEFNQMIDETKIGVILKGVRGEKPRAIDKLSDTLSKIQQIVFDLPQIVSIDMNPVLITSDRAVVVDFKIMIK